MNTATPETDAVREVWLTAKPNVELGDGRPISGNVVDVEFARKMERERDYMIRNNNKLRGDFDAVASEACQLQDALGFPCETENAQEKAMERLRDLIAAEGEIGDFIEGIKKIGAVFYGVESLGGALVRVTETIEQYRRDMLKMQRDWAAASSSLRGAIARLETIRETHGHHIALDRDIEIYREGLPESLCQNAEASRSAGDNTPTK